MKQLFMRLQDNLLEKTKKLAAVYRWAITFCILLGIGGMYLLVIHYPLVMHIASKRLAVKHLCKQLSCMHETEAELLAMSRVRDDMQGAFAKKALNGSFSHVLKLLFSSLNTAGLSIKQYHFKECVQKNNWCKKYEITMTFSGPFNAIESFYTLIQQADVLLFIKNIKVESMQDAQQMYACTLVFSLIILE